METTNKNTSPNSDHVLVCDQCWMASGMDGASEITLGIIGTQLCNICGCEQDQTDSYHWMGRYAMELALQKRYPMNVVKAPVPPSLDSEKLKAWFTEHGWHTPHITQDEQDVGLEWARGNSRLTVFVGPEGIGVCVSEKELCDHLWVNAENEYVKDTAMCIHCYGVAPIGAVTLGIPPAEPIEQPPPGTMIHMYTKEELEDERSRRMSNKR